MQLKEEGWRLKEEAWKSKVSLSDDHQTFRASRLQETAWLLMVEALKSNNVKTGMQAASSPLVNDAQVQTEVVPLTSEACQTDSPNGIDFQVQAYIEPDRRTIGTEIIRVDNGERSNIPSSSGLNKAKKNTVPASKAPSRKTNPCSSFEDTTFTGRIVSITPNRSGVGTCEILMKVSELIKYHILNMLYYIA